jgi:hypothetical protein
VRKWVTAKRPEYGGVLEFIFTADTSWMATDGNITIILFSKGTVKSISGKCKSPPVKAFGS